MEKAFNNVGKAVSGLFAGFVVNRAFQAFVTDVADLGDKLAKMSDKTGVAVEDLQKLSYAAELSDVSTDQLGASLQRLNRVMGESRDGSKSASEALARFGITGSDSALDAFNKIADRVKNTDDIARASSALSDVFGKQFADLIPLLKDGSAAIKEAGHELERTGGIMSKETTDAAKQFKDDMTRLNKQFEAMRINIGGPMIQALANFSDSMRVAAEKSGSLKTALAGLFLTSGTETANPTKAIQEINGALERQKKLREELMARPLLNDADIRLLSAGIAMNEAKLPYLKALQEQRAMAGSEGIYSNEGRGAGSASTGAGIAPAAPKGNTAIDKAQQAYDNLIKSIREKIAVQDAELGITGKITDAGKEYAKFLADVTNGYLKLTPEQLSKLAPMWDEFLKKAEQLQAKQRDIETAAARTQIGDLRDQFGRGNEARTDELTVMPEAQRRLRDALRAVDEQARQTGDAIRALYADGKIDADQYEQLMREINDAIDGQKDRVGELEALQDRLNASWEVGADRAFTTYIDRARDVATQAEEAFTRAFGGMEDALVKFVQTGKLDFSSLADQIIADLIRIQIKAAATSLFSQAGGDFFSSLFGGGGGGSSGLTMVANGGVFNSPSLSRFSGQVHDSPQFFQFANGAGVFGEAGPEAIMPLKRGRNGKLGVASEGGGSNVVVQVIEAPGRGGETNRRSEGGTDIIEVMVERVKSSVAGDIMRGNGKVPAAIERAYGVNRVAGTF